MPPMLATIPSTLRAGDTLSATWSAPDHPATAGWVLRLTLINSTARYQASAVASGADHVLTVAASTTAAWAAGAYTWTIDATLAAARATVATGSTTVLPDLASVTTYDARSPARKALDAAEALLATHGAKAHLQEIQYGDRRQKFTAPGELLAFISQLKAVVARETHAQRLMQGLSSRNKLMVRFGAR